MAAIEPLDSIGERFVQRDRVRSRADNRHLAKQHVVKLRKLIEVRSAQETTDFGDARVVSGGLAERLSIFDDMHRAKFENADSAISVPMSGLPEKYRP